jgi:murein DD-endopeptidase MepM/ murein hydrolase activator NlpD
VRILLAIAAVLLFGAIAVAASTARAPAFLAGPSMPPRHTAIPTDPNAPPPEDTVPRLRHPDAGLARRFIAPIEGADITADPELLPGAARDYRRGIHEGIDFPAPMDTPVRAAAAGTVIRVDSSFADWTAEEQDAALSEAVTLGYTPAATLDRIRGRQVWIDHGRGVVSRYAHLAAVEPLALGQRIEAGAPLGSVGSSGYPQGGPHLHFEVRVGDGFYADGLADEALVRAVSRLFR